MENWQADAASALPPGEERTRVLSLIEFLAQYDAHRDPRVYDIQGFLERMRDLYRDPSVTLPGTLRALVADSAPPREVQAAAGGGILTEPGPGAGVAVQGPPGPVTWQAIADIIGHHVAHGRRVLVVAESGQARRALPETIPAGLRDLTVSVPGTDAGRGIAAATQALLASREAEAERLPGWWAPGEAPTRAEAARWVAGQRPRLGYIDDPIAPGTPSPLTAGELGEFIRLIREVGVARADACARELPELTSIPFAAELEDRFEKRSRLEAAVRSLGDAVHDRGLAVACGREGLNALAARCHREMEWMAKNAGTWLGHVREQAEDPPLAADWLSFYRQVSADRQEVLRLRREVTAYRIVLPEPVGPALVDGLEQAKQRLSELGKLGMFAGPAKRAVQECEVDGRTPVTVADIDLCLQAAALDNLRGRLRTSWQNQVSRVGGAELEAEAPEDVLGPFLEDLQRVLDWPRAWAQLRADLDAAGVSSPAAADPDTLGRLADVCAGACDQLVVQELSRRFLSLDEWLRAGARSAAASPLWELFVDALAREDLELWHQLREELKDLLHVAPQARWLRELRGRLSAGAPLWTARILADPAAAGDPADFDAAWQWRQLDSWVREAPAGSATHAWIMPAALALTSFRPENDPPFDVLIVDEASQTGLEALPLLALAGSAVVVGDGRPVTPRNAGLDRQQVSDLLDQHLTRIPGYRTRFDPSRSLYDIAARAFPGVVTLTETPGPVAPEESLVLADAVSDEASPVLTDAVPADAGPAAPRHGRHAAATPGPADSKSAEGEPVDAEPVGAGPAAETGARGEQAGPSLLPYEAWTERELPHPDTAALPEVIAGLREIVTAEGPIRTQRAYRLYTRAAGGRRIGQEMRRAFHAATRQALETGQVRQLEDDAVPLDDKTLFVSGKPSVLVRELGPRQLSDVPRSELAKLIKFLRLGGAADDVVKRAVLSAYGVTRLTARASQYLDECLTYDHRRPAPGD